jgi:tetratricopeptide (TPR) repeat protein
VKRWPWLLPVLAGAAAYAIAPFGELVWDDQLVARQQMAAIRGVADAFVPPAGIAQWTYNYYRPLVVLSYLLDQALFGRGAAAGPHVTNVVLHLLATVGVGLLARRLLAALPGGAWGASFAAALFAVHPVHVESVSWVTGRSDVLATACLLPALLALLRWRDDGSMVALLAAPAFFLAALLAKEVALAGLVLAPLVLLAAPPRAGRELPRGRAAALAWGGAVVALLGAVVAWVALRRAGGTVAAPLEPVSLAEAALRALRALGWYVGKLAWPWPQSNFVPWGAAPAAGTAALLVAVPVAGLLAAVAASRRPGARVAAVALAWTGVTIAPALAIALTPVAATPLAERYLYLPSVGLSLLAGAAVALAAAGPRPRLVVGAAVALVAALGAATLARGATWLTDLRLWTDAVAKAGDHAVPLIEYGKAQFQAGAAAQAESSFARARAVADTPRLRATAAYNLGIAAATRGDLAGAARHFEDAVAADPGYALGHFGLGRVFYAEAEARAARGDGAGAAAALARARAAQEQALRLNPAHAAGQLQLGLVLAAEARALAAAGDAGAAAARLRLAAERLDRALALEPGIAARPEARALRERLGAAAR